MLLEEREEGPEDKEEDVSSCWMNFREKRRYRKFQRKAQNRSLWRKVFGRGCGTVVDRV
jgi:hypothetical protein